MLMFNEVKATAPVSTADAGLSEADFSGPAAAPPPVNLKESLKQGEPVGEKPRIFEEVVIEEVSIDGMCGVY